MITEFKRTALNSAMTAHTGRVGQDIELPVRRAFEVGVIEKNYKQDIERGIVCRKLGADVIEDQLFYGATGCSHGGEPFDIDDFINIRDELLKFELMDVAAWIGRSLANERGIPSISQAKEYGFHFIVTTDRDGQRCQLTIIRPNGELLATRGFSSAVLNYKLEGL